MDTFISLSQSVITENNVFTRQYNRTITNTPVQILTGNTRIVCIKVYLFKHHERTVKVCFS